MRRIGVFRSDGRKRRTASCIHSVSLSFIMNDCQDLQTSRHKRSLGVWTGCSQDARFVSVLHAAEFGVSHVFAASFLRFLCRASRFLTRPETEWNHPLRTNQRRTYPSAISRPRTIIAVNRTDFAERIGRIQDAASRVNRRTGESYRDNRSFMRSFLPTRLGTNSAGTSMHD